MTPPREIPGFFWDEDKKKYFKIEQRGPPAASQYSAQNVKKRQAEAHDEAVKAMRAAIPSVRPDAQNPLADPIVGGLFRHDLGEQPPDLARACWVDGLQFKGAAVVGSPWGGSPVVSFLVTGAHHQQGDDGLIIAATTREDMVKSVFSRDKYNHVQDNPSRHSKLLAAAIPPMPIPITGLAWGRRSDAEDPGWPVFAYSSAEVHGGEPGMPFLYLRRGPSGQFEGLNLMNYYEFDCPEGTSCIPPVTSCVTAPGAARGIMAVVGTKHGLATIDRTESVSEVGFAVRSPGSRSTGNTVLALDFVNDHPDVLVLGGRGGTGIWITDLREAARQLTRGGNDDADRLDGPQEQQPNILACHPGHHDARYAALKFPECTTPTTRVGTLPNRDLLYVLGNGKPAQPRRPDTSCRWLEVSGDAGGAVNHVVSLNQYQVLAAGIGDRMDIWDMRRGLNQQQQQHPCTSFPGYKNAARLGTGLAVDKKLGIVAAANYEGPDSFCPVKLHSLATGREMPCRALDDEMQHLQGLEDPNYKPPLGIPSPCLRWETLRGDRDASLFVARGNRVLKFSFGLETGLVDEF
ncbi:hypothetical protein MCOR25_001339 [Pyricularia grisea]|uniref:Uncharacterized protein n=1 Tax=Pyricularia grisea TaxID=148305 RepID=A0A6P8B3E5_PYRGI|nr:uncharacterized protein PgNI_07614 [Pyricularia grisea]KAI6381038.1 hypothetical protein MCOR25_001339 [Pyricularia grisea]TLD09391.1 hypothetical protein PgNI_07614 [Pyricularia grisea]